MTDNEATWAGLSDAQQRMMERVAKRMETSHTLIVINALDNRTWGALVKRGLVVNERGATKFTTKGRAVYEAREASQTIDTPADDALGKAQARIAALESAIRAALDKLQSVGDGLPGASDEYSDLLDTFDILRAALHANDAIGGG